MNNTSLNNQDSSKTVKSWIDFTLGCNVCHDNIMAYPIMLESGKQVGTFRYHKQSKKWYPALSRPEPGIYLARGVPLKHKALRLLYRRLQRQGRILIDQPGETDTSVDDMMKTALNPEAKDRKPCTINQTPSDYSDGEKRFYVKASSKKDGRFISDKPGWQNSQSEYIGVVKFMPDTSYPFTGGWCVILYACYKLNRPETVSEYLPSKEDALKELRFNLEIRGYRLVSDTDE